ncbi:MAG: phosphotransferase family protein [Marmoricola sp.]|nr:phosphotransferase family protein [Marmoricola sp.]
MTWDWDARSLGRLGRFLADRGLTGPDVEVHRIGDGHSNLTYLVDDGERRVVVRRGPPPPTPPGAHDMLREARILAALQDTDVPVPVLHATAEPGEVLDVPCYVMSLVEGPVVTTETPAALHGCGREIGEHLVEVLAALHSVDWRVVGGRPEGFNRRHLAAVARLVPDEPPPGFADLRVWLEAHAPEESGAAIVHNDYRLGNVVLAPEPPGRVAAVLDWELATVGDPLFDLGYFLASVPEGAAVTATEEMGAAMLEAGWPSRAELATQYAAITGRDIDGLDWYVALAQWKLAALYEYQRRRADDPYYDDPALVPAFLLAGRRAVGLERA